jgi:hypothetical protein
MLCFAPAAIDRQSIETQRVLSERERDHAE